MQCCNAGPCRYPKKGQMRSQGRGEMEVNVEGPLYLLVGLRVPASSQLG